jgi:hypothetical protein
MYRASICPSSGVQYSGLPHMMSSTEKRYKTTTPNLMVLYVFSVLDITCGSPVYCTPDDGHIDARNMLS